MSKKKNIKKFENILDKFKKNQDVIKIERYVSHSDANIFGVLLAKSENFLHMAETDEFIFNGEVIIRTDDFDSIRRDDIDIRYKEILTKEGKLGKNKPKKTAVDLTSWKSIFKDLKSKDIHAIVECENLTDPTFTIGPIEKVNNKSVELRYYDAVGQLEEKTWKIKFKDITTVKFNDRYSKTFRKYLTK